jgi:hypothetical protein
MRRLRKFAALPRRDRLLLARGWIQVFAIRVAIRMLPYRLIRKMVEKRTPRRFAVDAARPDRTRIAWAVLTASRYVPGGSNCLVRATAAESILRGYGYEASLKIGVRRSSEGKLAAHAWLESDGEPILGAFDLESYATLNARQPDASEQELSIET